MERRAFLKTGVATGSIGVLGGCSFFSPGNSTDPRESPIGEAETTGTPPPTPSPTTKSGETPTPDREDHAQIEGIAFDRVVDGVADLGMDPTGNRPIDARLSDVLTPGTLVELPPGWYLTNERHTINGLERWGIRGLGDDRTKTRIIPPVGAGHHFLNFRSGRDVLVQNLTFDVRPGPHEWLTNVFKLSDGLRIQDVGYAGFYASDITGRRVRPGANISGPLHIHVTSSNGLALVDRLFRRGPTHHAAYPGGHSCIFVGPSETVGTVRITNSHIENMSSHGIYASRTRGTIEIENSTFKNNNGANCRLSGPDSYIRDSRIVLDTNDVVEGTTGTLFNSLTSGIWIESGFRTQAGGTISNCRISMRSVPEKVRGIEVDGSAGRTTIRDTAVEISGSVVRPVDINRPGSKGSRVRTNGKTPTDPKVTLQNVSVTGAAPGPGAGIDIVGRPGATLENCHVEISGLRPAIALEDAGRFRISGSEIEARGGDGLRLLNSADGLIEDSKIVVQGFPIVVQLPETASKCPLRVSNVEELLSRVYSTDEALREFAALYPGSLITSVPDGDGCLNIPRGVQNRGEFRVASVGGDAGFRILVAERTPEESQTERVSSTQYSQHYYR